MAKTAITVKIFFMAWKVWIMMLDREHSVAEKIGIFLKIQSLSDIPLRASFGKRTGAVVGTVPVCLTGNLKQPTDTKDWSRTLHKQK
jgi:formate/nitrite transporter FocA (FNT family)